MSRAAATLPISDCIHALRGQRVMLDADLAVLYGVETRALVQAVKRNAARFPSDFMFQLTSDEIARLTSQTVISRTGHGGRRTAPYAFTEQGVAMLSSVLTSPRAIAVNVEIMRTFVRMRELAATHADVAKRLQQLEKRADVLAGEHDALSRDVRTQLRQVFEAIRQLMIPPEPKKRPIGFVTPEDKPAKKPQ